MAVQKADYIWRNFEVDGVSASGFHKPVLGEQRVWGTWVEQMISAGLSNGGLIYDTKASMDADLAHDANASAWVMTGADAGIYRKVGASGSGLWTRVADLPYSYIKASNVGAGTANALQATTDIPVPAADGAALIALPITVDNTASPVTVSFNDSTPLTIKTSAGNDVASGGLKAGMVVSGYVSGSTFRMLSDQASDAIVADAEAAKEAAEAAAASIEYKQATSRTIMASMTADRVWLLDGERTGAFAKVSSDISAFVAADTVQGHYVPFASDASGASGGYVRMTNSLDWDFSHFAGAGVYAPEDASTDASEALASVIRLSTLFGSILSAVSVKVSGFYLVDSLTSYASTKEMHLAFRGTGRHTSGFVSGPDNADGLLEITHVALRTSSFEIHDMALIPGRDGAGKAIKFYNNSGGAQDQILFHATNVHAGPLNDTSDGAWNDIFDVQCYRPVVDRCYFYKGGASTTKMGTILNFPSSYKFEVLSSYVKGSADYGIKSIGIGEEASRIEMNSIVGPDVGIYIERDGREPEHYISRNHINCAIANVRLDGVKHGWIKENLFHADLATGTMHDIELRSAEGINIGGNCYRNTGTGATRTHVYMRPGDSAHAGVISHIVIEPNELLRAVAARYVQVGAGSTDVTVNEPPRLQITSDIAYPNDLTLVSPISTSRIYVNSRDDATFTPTLTFGGAAVGMTGTFTGKYRVDNGRLIGYATITLTAKGSSTGNAEIGLPTNVNRLGTRLPQANVGIVQASLYTGMGSLTAPVFGRVVNATTLRLLDTAAGAISNLDDTNFGDASSITVNFDLPLGP